MIELLGVRAEEGLERAERQRVHQDADVRHAAGLLGLGVEPRPQCRQELGPVAVVGRVHVDEQRLAPVGRDVCLDLVDVGHALAPIEVDAGDVVAGGRQRLGRRLAEAAAGTEDEGPRLSGVGHGGRSPA